MKIKVIKSIPRKRQKGINNLIGKIFDVLNFEKETTGDVSIFSRLFGGQIVLNKGEYQIL